MKTASIQIEENRVYIAHQFHIILLMYFPRLACHPAKFTSENFASNKQNLTNNAKQSEYFFSLSIIKIVAKFVIEEGW